MMSYTTASFSTYKAEFSATLIQTDAILLSDIFEVEVEFGWLTDDYAKSNAAFLKIKFFIESVIHQSVLTHPSTKINMTNIDNKVVMLPHAPANDVIAMALHSKLNAIVRDQIEVIAINILQRITGNY